MKSCRRERMINICFDEKTYHSLIRILQEKYYSTTLLNELSEINQIFNTLNCKPETWMSNFSRK